MRALSGPGRVFMGSMQGVVTGALCVLMVAQPVAAGATVVKRGPTAGVPPAKNEGRVLHALNRMTFGPRPGDVAAVSAMGLNKWFEMQLNPEQIDDSGLQARLAMFPAMQLPQQELMARYPSQQMIRQMSQRDASLPLDAVEHPIYADEMAFYKMQQANKAASDAAAAATKGTAGAGTDSMTGDSMAAGDSAAPAMAAKKVRRTQAQAQMGAGQDPSMANGAGGDRPMSGGAAASMPNYAAMANGTDATAPLPKDAVTETGQAPDKHVEKLFADLAATNIINLPPQERMKKVLAMAPDDFVSFRQSLSGPELAQFGEGLAPQQKEIFAAMQNSTRMVGAEEMQVRLLRDIYSERQLEAVMTDFWLNHFNVYVRKNQNEPYYIPAYERETIRPHALGKFEDLLVATAKSPAMLMYLDNWQSIGPDSQAAHQGPALARFAKNPQVKAALKDRGLNENYGRELMELHTLGVNGGYTQADVTQVAKVFTGWTIDRPYQAGAGGGGGFSFDERKHEPGSKTVLGKTIKENGMNEGLEVLHMLATSPATAKFISTKLAVRFVADDPPPALVDRMTQAYLSSDGDIKTVLRAMFESPEFWTPEVERSKVKTPLEFVTSAVRASGATVSNSLGLVLALDRLGMPLYGMQTPNGYSWQSGPWVSTGALVSRMNFALVMAGDKLPGVTTDWTKLLGSAGRSKGQTAEPVSISETDKAEVDPEVAAKERRLEMVLLGQPLSEKTRAAVIGQSGDSTAAMQAAREFQGGGAYGKGDAAGIFLRGAFGMNGDQKSMVSDDRQAAIMAGLMLGSPEFQRR
jgi:uncharacterized protein (DUF1800 family)